MAETKDEELPGAAGVNSPVEVGTLAQLPPGSAMKVALGPVDLALVNVDGAVVAVGDLCLRCSHSLSAGTLSGDVLTCSCCGWQYDLARGHVLALPALRMEMHAVHIEEGRLLVASGIAAPAHAT